MFGALIFVSDVLVTSFVGAYICFYNSFSSFFSRGSYSRRFFGFVYLLEIGFVPDETVLKTNLESMSCRTRAFGEGRSFLGQLLSLPLSSASSITFGSYSSFNLSSAIAFAVYFYFITSSSWFLTRLLFREYRSSC